MLNFLEVNAAGTEGQESWSQFSWPSFCNQRNNSREDKLDLQMGRSDQLVELDRGNLAQDHTLSRETRTSTWYIVRA